MTDQQGLRQASIRAVTGTTYDYDGDWHALFDAAGIATGDFNGRLLTWINRKLSTSYDNLPGAMAAFAAANGATNFAATGTFNALIDPLTAFTYDINFAANTVKGGTQTYGNNTNDGRFFRDSGVFQSCFCENSAGLLVAQAAAGMRRTDKGAWLYPDIVPLGLWGRDLTQAAWTKTNVTAVKNQTGADGSANAASSITATADAGTVSQAITSASANRVRSVYVKRLVGVGTLEMSLDGGTTWTVITTTASYSRAVIAQAAVTNPTIMYRIGTSGDSFAIDFDMTHGQIRGADIASGYVVGTVGSAYGTLNHSTPWALNTDAGPLYSVIPGAFAFYWQGSGAVANAGGLFVSDSVAQAAVAATNSMQMNTSPSLLSGNNQWVPGLGNRNKVAGWIDGAGNMRLCVNGNTPVSRTGGVLSPAATHFVLASNGSGGAALCGFVERFAISANLTFTDAQLIAMTT